VELNDRAMKALLQAFDRSDWQEMTITVGSDTLHVSRQTTSNGAAPALPTPPAAAEPGEPAASGPAAADAPAPAAAVTTADAAPGKGIVVESPSVGLFWRAPSPGAPPFVEVGARVEAGDTVAIVEVMKLMNHVSVPVGGVVTSILVENGASVEYGQALVTIDPEG
jgi:acetyl-CoA carboxylase biotin carboxyl carrier protein